MWVVCELARESSKVEFALDMHARDAARKESAPSGSGGFSAAEAPQMMQQVLETAVLVSRMRQVEVLHTLLPVVRLHPESRSYLEGHLKQFQEDVLHRSGALDAQLRSDSRFDDLRAVTTSRLYRLLKALPRTSARVM